MTLILHISLGFYLLSWSIHMSWGQGHSPMQRWGGVARCQQMWGRKTFLQRRMLSRHLSPTPECTFQPSHNLQPLCKMLVQRHSVMWSLWGQPAHPGSHPDLMLPSGSGSGMTTLKSVLYLWGIVCAPQFVSCCWETLYLYFTSM